MSDDLREQIAQALIRERQRRLAGVSMDTARADADAVLAVVQPVIEQAERFGESTQDWLRARVAALEAALRDLLVYAPDYVHGLPVREWKRRVLGEQAR